MNATAGRSSVATVFALVSAVLIIAHQVGGKATRDAIFLSQYDVTQLPRMLIVAALASMLAVLVMSRLLQRFGPWRVVPAAMWLSAALFLLNWSLYARQPALAALTLYLQTAVFGAVLISGFWSVVNERFDPHTARRSIARIAAAATLGGVLGGLLAGSVAALLDARAMLAVLGLLQFVCGITVYAIGRPRSGAPVRDVTVSSGVQILFAHRYLVLMGLLMVLIAALAAVVDYAFKAEATRHITDRDALVGFFGRFYAVVSLVTFAVQLLLGPRVLNRFGIGVTLAVMPAVILVNGLLTAVLVRLWAVTILRASQIVLQNSFFRSSFELLYTPLPPAHKRPTKAIIDVASDRLGDVVGGGIVLALLAVMPAVPAGVVVLTAMLLALVALFVVRRLYAGYIAQLADNLRDGAISLNEDDVIDATTRQTLAEVTVASERSLLMARIRKLRERRGVASGTWTPHPATVAPPHGPGTALAQAIAELTSGDAGRIRACLEGAFMDPRLANFIVPMLAVEELADLARTELRWLAPRCLGALTDALLDPDLPLLARQRLPSVIEVSYDARAVEALLQGVDDAEFNVRYSSARALSRMTGRDPDLRIDAARVYAACTREVAVTRDDWEARDIRLDRDDSVDYSLGGEAQAGASYSLDHVFTLLSLVLDRDALKLSFRAVFSTDRAIRGTALEYLENVLPDSIRHGLWPHLGEAVRQRSEARRTRDALVEELKRARWLGT